MDRVTWRQVAGLRLERQGLAEPAAGRGAIEAVVRAHVGIQAQVMSSAELAVGARVDGLRPGDVRDALWRERSLVKTWAMRGTLHLVAADDLPELVRGLGTRLNWLTPAWLRWFGVTREQMIALQEGIGEVLGDEPMTREELAGAVAERLGDPAFARHVATSWGTFLKPAAGLGRLAFGPDRGRNVTFVHPAAWLGQPMPDPADDGIDAPLLRHLRAFPGSTRDELARWWGGRAGEINAALRRLGEAVVPVDVEGVRGLLAAGDVAELRDPQPGHVRLLGGFDPYTLSLQKEAEPLLPLARRPLVSREAGWISAVLLVDGAVQGTWSHDAGPRRVRVDLRPWRRLTRRERRRVEAEAARIAACLSPGTPGELSVAEPA